VRATSLDPAGSSQSQLVMVLTFYDVAAAVLPTALSLADDCRSLDMAARDPRAEL